VIQNNHSLIRACTGLLLSYGNTSIDIGFPNSPEEGKSTVQQNIVCLKAREETIATFDLMDISTFALTLQQQNREAVVAPGSQPDINNGKVHSGNN
jgi:hypothetical protein